MIKAKQKLKAYFKGQTAKDAFVHPHHNFHVQDTIMKWLFLFVKNFIKCNQNKKYLKIKSGLLKIRLNINWIRKSSKILNFYKNTKDFMI